MSGHPPTAFLYQEHVNELFRQFQQTGDTEAAALGMAIDGGEVFHVYLTEPRIHFSGQPCRATVRLHRGPAVREAEIPAGVRLVVDIGITGDDLTARGRIVLDAGGTREIDVKFVPVQGEMYVRAKGLVPTAALARKSVAVVGLGSGGSAIAVALAQSGIGRMVLVDRDRIEVGNVARHACGIGDLGRRKTNAVRDLALGKNPDLDVVTADLDVVEDVPALQQAVDGVDLLVAATDSDRSRFMLNQYALDLRIPTVFGRVLSRASGGEVLRVRPFDGPCLACVYTTQFLAQRPREYSRMSEAREEAQAYVDPGDLEQQIQVGLASDIAPVSNLMVKLALVELSRGAGGGLDSLDEDLRADFYVWANRREGVYAGWPQMGFEFTKPAVLRWYGANVGRRADCGACHVPDPASVPDAAGFFG
ncbi:ThiF family adenylyltransferase [Micromonospora rifamycinica]|uniref:HesA/MoeB/ThiF family protein n=1 Tax=Micromonospora rifamycinica TaxID=291594 RepID=UPI002E2C868F|nr:ThiF family adenylyltransferase [Micromonospora rifamycinica]